MEAASCDDWLVAGFMIPNKIIFTAAIKKKNQHLIVIPVEYFTLEKNRTFNSVTR